MVCHVRADAARTRELQAARRPVVDGFVQAHRTEHAQAIEVAEVADHLRSGERQASTEAYGAITSRSPGSRRSPSSGTPNARYW